MTKFLKHTTEWIGRTTIFCNQNSSNILPNRLVGLPTIPQILPNRLVGLPYFVMTKFLKYTTEWIGRTTIYCNDKSPQIYYRMDW